MFIRILSLLVFFFGGVTFALGEDDLSEQVLQDKKNLEETLIVNDISQLNPILVDTVISPESEDDITVALFGYTGSISIGGGRNSMGGQTATEGTRFFNMKTYNDILGFDKENKTITVQSGITRYDIQKYIDAYDLSLMIMQSYANFSVGGSMSVNGHGRYMGLGPLVSSVLSFTLVLPNADIVRCSPSENADLFYAAIGGYGGVGIISEVTLQLVDNEKIEREVTVLSTKEYEASFFDTIKLNKDILFHNANIYPPAYDTVRSVTYERTDKEVTIDERLIPREVDYRKERIFLRFVSNVRKGSWIRQYIIDPFLYMGEQVTWRNYEASYDTAELEPKSRKRSTYVLQEYFIPVENFQSFVADMKEIFDAYNVNIMNVSIRHATPDKNTFLSRAPREVFAFVIYYKQGTGDTAKAKVKERTRDLIDRALELEGTYYLPYQIHATSEQFQRAYPRYKEFFEIKDRVDPSYQLRNKLWDEYYAGAGKVKQKEEKMLVEEIRASTYEGYEKRSIEQSLYTYPERFVVYVADQYATHLAAGNSPSSFGFRKTITQFWSGKKSVYSKIDEQGYQKNSGYEAMISFVGITHTIESFLKLIYETTLGFSTFQINRLYGKPTGTDKAYASFMQKYSEFIYTTPWYEFDYWRSLKTLRRAPRSGSLIRNVERRLIYTLEFVSKGLFGKVMGSITKHMFGEERLTTVIKGKKNGDDVYYELSRYHAFTDQLLTVLRMKGFSIEEIEGNEKILVSYISPVSYALYDAGSLLQQKIDDIHSRFLIYVDVHDLSDLHENITGSGGEIEHIYDY